MRACAASYPALSTADGWNDLLDIISPRGAPACRHRATATRETHMSATCICLRGARRLPRAAARGARGERLPRAASRRALLVGPGGAALLALLDLVHPPRASASLYSAGVLDRPIGCIPIQRDCGDEAANRLPFHQLEEYPADAAALVASARALVDGKEGGDVSAVDGFLQRKEDFDVNYHFNKSDADHNHTKSFSVITRLALIVGAEVGRQRALGRLSEGSGGLDAERTGYKREFVLSLCDDAVALLHRE